MADNIHVFSEKKLEMSEEEMGQIALKIIRKEYPQKIRLKPGFSREAGELAKELGVKRERVMVFMQIIACEAFEKSMFK